MRILIPLIALVGFACASSTPQSNPAPAAAPDTPKPEEVDPSAQIAGDTQSPTESETQPVISEEDRAQARNLIAQGQELQREKGEGGAEEAISLYRQALELDPEAAEAYWELGWSYQVLDELDEALTAWDRVREIAPDYPELELYYPVLKMRHEQQEKLQALPEPGMIPEPELEPYRGPSVRFAAVGDVQTGRAWPEHRTVLPPNEGQGYFDGVKEWLQDADVTFGNLEEVLADEGNSTKCGPKSTKCFAFRVPTSHADLFKDAGFDMMSVANNHAGDFGPAGRQATMAALDEAGIVYSGPVGVIATHEHNGLRIGMIAFSTGGGVYRLQELETARRVVADVDRTHDIVVVSFHGGAEGTGAANVPKEVEKFYGENRGDVYRFAHAMVDAGADLIFGHGPHVLRGAEIYKGRLVAYSLGNFSSYKTFGLTRNLGWSTVLHVTIAPNGVALEAKINPVILKGPGRPVKDPKRNAIKEIRRLSREDFGNPLFNAKGEWKRPEDPKPPVALYRRDDSVSLASRDSKTVRKRSSLLVVDGRHGT